MDNEWDRDLAGKVDALIGKHGAPNDDRNIPVLTDLVAGPVWQPQASAIAQHVKSDESTQRVSQALLQLDDSEIDALSQEIFTRVFDRIDSELAGKLEERLSSQLAVQISAAVTHVLGDLRLDIANEVGDAVNAALADHLRKK